ncbi:MAG: CBS domain-containing protein [Thermodesulfobacteriota bacterium]
MTTTPPGHREVRHVMTPVVRTLRHDDHLEVADELMAGHRIRHLPVLDERGVVCGIVSQRDLFRGALAKALGYGRTAQHRLHSTLRVREVMSPHVVTIGPFEPIENAARLMLEHKIGCLPVVDGQKLVGIVTETDFVELVLEGSGGLDS